MLVQLKTCTLSYHNISQFVFRNIIWDHICVHNIRQDRSNTDRYSMIHAGGSHWPEHDALIDIASIVVED